MRLPGSEEVRSPDDLESFEIVAAGNYHVRVDEVDDSFTKARDAMYVRLEVLAGDHADQVGKFHRERVPVSGKGVKRAVKLAMATGLITPQDLGRELDLDFQATVGRQLCVKLIDHSYTSDKTGKEVQTTQVDYLGFYALTDPEAKDVPLDRQLAAMVLGNVPAAAEKGANGNGRKSPPGRVEQPSDDWSQV